MYDKILSTLEAEFQKKNVSLHSSDVVEHGVLSLANIIVVRHLYPEKCSFSEMNGKYIRFSFHGLGAIDVDTLLAYLKQYDNLTFYHHSSENNAHCFVINTKIFHDKLMPLLIQHFNHLDNDRLQHYQQQTQAAIEKNKREKEEDRLQAQQSLVTLKELEDYISPILVEDSLPAEFVTQLKTAFADFRRGVADVDHPDKDIISNAYDNIERTMHYNQHMSDDEKLNEILNRLSDFGKMVMVYTPPQNTDVSIAHSKFIEENKSDNSPLMFRNTGKETSAPITDVNEKNKKSCCIFI